MKINQKDFIVVNGKKYYAEGGDMNEQMLIDREGDPKWNPEWIYSSDKNPNGINYNLNYSNIHAGKTSDNSYNRDKSPDRGHTMFSSMNDNQRGEFLRGYKLIGDWLGEMKDNDDFKKEMKSRGLTDTDISNFQKEVSSPYSYKISNKYGKNGEEEGFDSPLHQKVRGLFAKYNPEVFEADSSSNGVYLGDQARRAIMGLRKGNNISLRVPEEREAIKKALDEAGISLYGGDRDWYRADLPDNTAMYTIFTGNGDRRNVVYDKESGKVYGVQYKKGQTQKRDSNGNVIYESEGSILPDYVPVSEGHINHYGYINSQRVPTGVQSNSTGYRSYNVDNLFKAYGGQLNRYYADGGAMGQIPLGEQEPEGYNMVGAGGMHEENPMGGVPYGVNQDGSQNMVEQGEVSMGDNVFSDRSQLSPELCQQLGLPEGTTPAQAMQQIEQLYEQGQLSDEEFQEVQQIIFQDQEAQKENMGGSYQQGEVGGPGVPNEGIDPNMGGMPMDPMAMQGGQPEGITPDMIQGQGGFGGY